MSVYIIKANPLDALIGATRKDGGASIQVLQGYPTLDASQDDLTVVAKYIIDWDQIDNCRKGFLGYNTLSGGIFTRYNPYQLQFAGENVFATKYSAAPFDVIKKNCSVLTGEYNFAVITVEFKPRALNISSNISSPQLFTESAAPQAVIEQIDADGSFWDTGATEPVDSNKFPSIKTSKVLWALNYTDIPEMWDNWQNMEGKTNSDTVTRSTLKLTFAPETLLVQEIDVNIGIGPDGTEQVGVRFSALYQEGGWNKFKKTKVASPTSIYNSSGTELKPFPPEFNFGNILPGL